MLGGTSKELGNAFLRFTVGEKICEMRKARGRTCEELAEFVGVSSREMNEYEMGRSSVSIESLVRISQYLDVVPQDIFNGIHPE